MHGQKGSKGEGNKGAGKSHKFGWDMGKAGQPQRSNLIAMPGRTALISMQSVTRMTSQAINVEPDGRGTYRIELDGLIDTLDTDLVELEPAAAAAAAADAGAAAAGDPADDDGNREAAHDNNDVQGSQDGNVTVDDVVNHVDSDDDDAPRPFIRFLLGRYAHVPGRHASAPPVRIQAVPKAVPKGAAAAEPY